MQAGPPVLARDVAVSSSGAGGGSRESGSKMSHDWLQIGALLMQ